DKIIAAQIEARVKIVLAEGQTGMKSAELRKRSFSVSISSCPVRLLSRNQEPVVGIVTQPGYIHKETTMGNAKKINLGLWIAQWLLALMFVLASGAPKLLLPADTLPMPIPLPTWFVLFIGVCEVLGGLGLVLPGLFHIRTDLTVWAALGLVEVTVGATVYNL